MKAELVENVKNNFALKSKTLLAALALVVVIALGTMAQGAQKGVDEEIDRLLLYQQTSLFNPFTLETITQSSSVTATGSDLGALTLVEPLRIPPRPPKRSPGKPWWVPGPPPWHKFK